MSQTMNDAKPNDGIERERLPAAGDSGPEFPDTEGLGRVMPDVVNIEEVNGEGARAIPDFVPTRHELKQLVAFWYRELLDTAGFCQATNSCGSTEWRIMQYADRRLVRLEHLLGEDVLKSIKQEVKNDLRVPDLADPSCPFAAAHRELDDLTREWIREVVDSSFTTFTNGGDFDVNIARKINDRLTRLGPLIGTNAVEDMADEVIEEFRKRNRGDAGWSDFAKRILQCQ